MTETKMPRFPTIPEDEMTDGQKLVEEYANIIASKIPPSIELKRADGRIVGPYPPIYYADDIAEPWFRLSLDVRAQKRFTIKEMEIAVLAVLSEYDAPFVHYAHCEWALVAGLSREQIQQAVHGKLPNDLQQREAMVYSLALKLARLHRPMDDETFEEARKVLGRGGVVGLAHLVSNYINACMFVNIADSEVPPPKEGTFRAIKNPAFK